MTDAQLLRLLEDLVTTFNTLTDTVCGFRDGDSENGELTAREQARGVVWFGKRTT